MIKDLWYKNTVINCLSVTYMTPTAMESVPDPARIPGAADQLRSIYHKASISVCA